MTLLQITSDTTVTMTVVQVGSVIAVLFLIIGGYFKLLGKIKDLTFDIANLKVEHSVHTMTNDRVIAEVKKEFEEKIKDESSKLEKDIQRMEETSKTFYKQSEVKYLQLEVKMDKLSEILISIDKKFDSHLVRCEMNHSK